MVVVVVVVVWRSLCRGEKDSGKFVLVCRRRVVYTSRANNININIR